jgi:hypothetical protein
MTTTNLTNNLPTTFLSLDGDKSISISQTGLSLKRDLLTTPIETIFTPLDITDVNTGNSITIDRLTYLPIGLAALTVPTDGLTCNFNDAIQLQDYNTTLAPPPIHSEVKIGSNPSTLYGMNIDTTTSTPFTITGNTGLTANINEDISLTSITKSITLTAEDNLNIVSSALGNINLDAPNINSFNYAMPICFDILTIDRNSGGTPGGQTWQNIWIENANLPPQFFVDSPISGYFSYNWRIDFTIQTWDAGGQDNSSDKALAYYIDFEDQNNNVYTPILFNATYPFCRHNNNSTWSGGGSNTNFQPFTWTDYVDFGGLTGSGSGNLPLKIRLWFTSDNPKNFQFSMKVGLTRTNILP